jgi:hypothetical protein
MRQASRAHLDLLGCFRHDESLRLAYRSYLKKESQKLSTRRRRSRSDSPRRGDLTAGASPSPHAPEDIGLLFGARWQRVVLLLFGLVLPQILLYGPSLMGRKVLLPLETLTKKGIYLPTAANAEKLVPSDFLLSDEVTFGEPSLEYAAKEVRAGRIPYWNPQNFAGVPFARFPKYSPSFWLFCLWPHPITLAFEQLLKSVIAGLGAYLFFRRALGSGFWASVVGAWCYPLTGFFVQWQGFDLSYVVAWLPWILLAVSLTIRKPKGFGPVLLAISTALALVSGQLDVAGLVLLSSGLYAVSCLIEVHGWGRWNSQMIAPVGTLALGWGMGLAMATVYVVPLLEYAHTGERFARRAAGDEERPPVGISALPQVVLPNLYGSSRRGSVRVVGGNQLESSAAGYAGLLAALLAAPLAFCHRDAKARSFWWLGFLALSLAWVLNLPGIVQLMRMPGANTFSWNRWMLLTGFALTVLAVIGLDAALKGMVGSRPWFALPALLSAAVCGWCLYRLGHMPPAVVDFTRKAEHARADALLWGMPPREAAAMVQRYFHLYYGAGAALGAFTTVSWAVLSLGARLRGWMVAVIAGLMLTELLVYAYDVNPQSDPALYYPRLAAMEELKQLPPGRILCVLCLPPDLNLMVGLPDIRGYDAVDPQRLLDVLELARAHGTSSPSYARTQWFVPTGGWADDKSAHVSSVLSMLNVRYLIWSKELPPGTKAIIRRDGYEVVENERALPRAFVPQAIQTVGDGQELMDRLGSETFDAAHLSYVTEPVVLPAECRGTASIVAESPGEVRLEARMETAGMVVLADLWDQGWRASVDGEAARILVVNHVIRGVAVPAGEHHVVFRYEPNSIRIGWIVSGAALVITLGWLAGIAAWKSKRQEL